MQGVTNTRHLSSCRCVGCAQQPESLTDVSSSGLFRLPPSCTLKSIGYKSEAVEYIGVGI
ncbi:hypothetical protein CU280_00140 [Yersinia mollaretii]|nr:hypothetical protein CU280_00140 [Yersinia mollaretii]